MNAKILAVILIFVENYLQCESRRYDNFSLYSVVPIELDHLKFLQNLDKRKYIDMMFWKKPYKLYEDVQFIVSPKDRELFIDRAKHYRLKINLHRENIQAAFDSQIIQKYLRLKAESFNWQSYHSLDDIYQWLSDLALTYPRIVELEVIGKSAEGRKIFAIGIKRAGNRGKVIVEGGIHGSEWMSVEFVTYLIYQLLYDEKISKSEVMSYNWFIVPVVNPDGYDYSQKEDRLWRKNRRQTESGHGIDLNRNFGYNFGKFGSSNNPVDDNYCGPSAFSEPEVKAFAEYVRRKADNLKYYFSVHAYGQKLIIPYADRVNHVENYGEMENYGKQAILKMYKLNGVKYSVGTTYDTFGIRISGNSASWVKKNYKVKYVFTFLLRDNGSYGYALPPSQILPTCEETLIGLKEIMTARPKRMRTLLFSFSGQVCPRVDRILAHVFCLLVFNILCTMYLVLV